tara:strand:+ start:818 stop:1177 length:360 start_codon:yes stop_codon:yes gene_type:complete
MTNKTPEELTDFEHYKKWKAEKQQQEEAENNAYANHVGNKYKEAVYNSINKEVPVTIRDYLSKFILWLIVGTTITICVITIGAMFAPIIVLAVLGYGYYLLNKVKFHEFFTDNNKRNNR